MSDQQTQPFTGDRQRQRKLKLHAEELKILVDEVVLNYNTLFGPASSKTPVSRKKAIWAAILHKVNALGHSQRAVDMLKKKWTELKRKTKEKIAQNRSVATCTGGGPSRQVELTSLEKKIENIFTPEQQGVQGVTDTTRRKDDSQPGASSSTREHQHMPPDKPEGTTECEQTSQEPEGSTLVGDENADDQFILDWESATSPSPGDGETAPEKEIQELDGSYADDYERAILNSQQKQHELLDAKICEMNSYLHEQTRAIRNQTASTRKLTKAVNRQTKALEWQSRALQMSATISSGHQHIAAGIAALNSTLTRALEVINTMSSNSSSTSSTTEDAAARASAAAPSTSPTPNVCPPPTRTTGLRRQRRGMSQQTHQDAPGRKSRRKT
ncbi:nuclear apoptosis-inducing factor 1-like [Huso huso]|uniref:Nuclear apoptosis-inducing factor 1-like n=1 Tax=Huso huso TaxID=61971 RepID=A0ABR1A5N6_HUSHU